MKKKQATSKVAFTILSIAVSAQTLSIQSRHWPEAMTWVHQQQASLTSLLDFARALAQRDQGDLLHLDSASH